MNNSKLENNKKLLKLVAENPEVELKFFAQECMGDYNWNECKIDDIRIENMALYNEEIWLDTDDYVEKLYDELSDEYEDDDHLKQAVDKKMKQVEFNEYICVFLS